MKPKMDRLIVTVKYKRTPEDEVMASKHVLQHIYTVLELYDERYLAFWLKCASMAKFMNKKNFLSLFSWNRLTVVYTSKTNKETENV